MSRPGGYDGEFGAPGQPLRGPGQRSGLVVIAAVLAAAAVALTARAGPVPVTAPTPTGADSASCTRLLTALPQTLDGRDRRATTPLSPFTAAWGRPAVTLACGQAPQPDPASVNQFVVPEPTGVANLTWYENPFDLQLWQTREHPLLAVTLPDGVSLGDVLSDVTDVLRGRPVGS